jgi:L-threonylcarbamoyladenylate synthase
MACSTASAVTVQQAAAVIRAGGLLGLPTETVYGLAADADQPAAVAAIFSAKGRPADHPLIVHVAALDGGMGGVAHYCADVPPFARQLMAAFWPGPLTLILPRRPGVGAVAAGGQDSIGVRCPSHPLAQELLRALRQPAAGEAVVWGLAAPSANRFGRVSPTLAAHVASEFEDLTPPLTILDGGPCSVGIESTIIDCSRGVPVLLRPGAITPADVKAACGVLPIGKDELAQRGQTAPRASGTLESHYAPRARVRLMDAAALQAALDVLPPVTATPPQIAVYARSAVQTQLPQAVLRAMPAQAPQAAHDLFADLRAMDALGVSLIWVETPPPGQDWDGVRDRLQRAAA